MSEEIDKLLAEHFRGMGYGAKWSVSDFYDENRNALIEAIRSREDFDTDWYGVNKELQSGRVAREGNTFTCEASVTNDFDEEGTGSREIQVPPVMHPERVMNMIVDGLDGALADAEQSQKDNRLVILFSIHNSAGTWVDTYLMPTGEGSYLDDPPGDSYGKWGLQGEAKKLPKPVKEQMKLYGGYPEKFFEDAEVKTEYGRKTYVVKVPVKVGREIWTISTQD